MLDEFCVFVILIRKCIRIQKKKKILIYRIGRGPFPTILGLVPVLDWNKLIYQNVDIKEI